MEMMEERGLVMAHTTIMPWDHQYGPEIDIRIRPYLYRAVDSEGNTIEFHLSETR